ncbi:unnamed protein product, partial [Prorocentrum cordatum]
VHVRGVPSSCSLPDVAALLAGGGAGAPFCYRVSDGVVAAELESASAVEAAIALTGRVLAPPQTGHVRFPGEAPRRGATAPKSWRPGRQPLDPPSPLPFWGGHVAGAIRAALGAYSSSIFEGPEVPEFFRGTMRSPGVKKFP